MHTLITGVTGTLGAAVLNELQHKGIQVTALVRANNQHHAVQRVQVCLVCCFSSALMLCSKLCSLITHLNHIKQTL